MLALEKWELGKSLIEYWQQYGMPEPFGNGFDGLGLNTGLPCTVPRPDEASCTVGEGIVHINGCCEAGTCRVFAYDILTTEKDVAGQILCG